MLDIVGHIAQAGDGEHRRADHVLIVDQAAVLRLVGVALGAEADHRGILLIRHHCCHPVGGHGILVQHEGDDRARLDIRRVDLLHIDQRAGVIGGLHGAGQHGEHLHAQQPRSGQQQCQNHHQRHQYGADDVPDFFQRSVHKYSVFLSFSVSGRYFACVHDACQTYV